LKSISTGDILDTSSSGGGGGGGVTGDWLLKRTTPASVLMLGAAAEDPRDYHFTVRYYSRPTLAAPALADSVISVERGLTSHRTHYRSYRGRVLYGSKDPTNSFKALKEEKS